MRPLQPNPGPLGPLFPLPPPTEDRSPATSREVHLGLTAVGLLLLLIAAVHTADSLAGWGLARWGLQPRRLIGLPGILTMPLLHASWAHLGSNLLALLPLLLLLRMAYRPLYRPVLLALWLGSGWLLWSLGRPGTHVGASALVYGLIGFLLVSGGLRRSREGLALVFLILFITQGFALGFFPQSQTAVSWDGHLCGFSMGVASAIYYRPHAIPPSEIPNPTEPPTYDTPPDDWDYRRRLPEHLR